MLFHYDMVLAAVHRRIGGNLVGAHRNLAQIIARLQHLLEPKLLDELRRVLVDGCPAKFNGKGIQQASAEVLSYLVIIRVCYQEFGQSLGRTTNNEDKKDHVLTFPVRRPGILLKVTYYFKKIDC
jgi:hypothetical protein